MTGRLTIIRDYCKRKGYSEAYQRYWLDHPHCEICRHYSEAPHHICTRGARGNDDHADNLVGLCVSHHKEIHDIGVRTFAGKYPVLADKIFYALERPR